LRSRKVKLGLSPALERFAFKLYATTFGDVKLYRTATKAAYYLQMPLVRQGAIRKGIGPLAGWTASRFMPMKQKESFRDRWTKLQKELQATPPRINAASKSKSEEGKR